MTLAIVDFDFVVDVSVASMMTQLMKCTACILTVVNEKASK